MPQCKEVHPNSPHPSIFLCIMEHGHKGKHHTYDSFGRTYVWWGSMKGMEITRDTMKVDKVYVEPDGSAWFTPDGVGIYFYDTLEGALEDYADWRPPNIVYLDIPSDLD